MSDRRLGICTLSDELNINKESAQKIYENLNIQNICAKMVLTGVQAQSSETTLPKYLERNDDARYNV